MVVKYKKLLAFCFFLVSFNILNIIYFQNDFNLNVNHRRELVASLCECRESILIRHITEANLVTFDKVSSNDTLYENNLFNLSRKEYESFRFTCDRHNVLSRGPNQKILSYSIDEFNLEETLPLIEKVSSITRNLLPFWSIRVYFDGQLFKNKSIFVDFKCKYECKFKNVDVCDVNAITKSEAKLGNFNLIHWNLWKLLPCGDNFVDTFSSRSLTNWQTITKEFKFILKWFNARKYESHFFKKNETENISWFYDEYWSFHSSMNRNASNRLFHLLNTKFEKDFFQLAVLPIVETSSKFDTIKLAKKASNLSVLNFNEKVNDSFKKPLVKFALITDVQYADIDGFSSYGYFRYYRNSIKMVERVIKKWNKQEDLNFILQLGDLIDGYVNYKLNQTKEALEICLNVLNMINVNQLIGVPKLMHIWGNHEVFSLGPYELFNSQLATARLLNGSGGAKNVNYYSIDLTESLRLVVLDFFEISILGSNRKDKEFLKNKKLIDYYSNLRNLTKNPWEKDYFNRFQENNGAVSQTQLSWLRRQLNECKKSNKKVFIAGHNPILRETSDTHQSWNSEDILEVIWSFSETVLVHFNGHIHIGIHYKDPYGIYHITLPGTILATKESENFYAIIEVYDEKIVIRNKNPINESLTIYY